MVYLFHRFFMKKRNPVLSIIFLAVTTGLFGQQAEVNPICSDDAILNGLPRLTLPASYASRPLPSKKDNSRLIYFSGIYNQQVWNCNQASSIWTLFTYEINYLRGLNSSLSENQYSPMAVYNLLNYGNGGNGVSYFDSWNLVRSNGIAANPDFSALSQNSQMWMDGYDKYYRGMKNRVDEVFAIDVSNSDGLLTLKHWINDHLSGAQVGGLANFQIGSDGMVIPQIPLDKGLEEEGQYILIKYGPYVGHAMTFAGWNDSVRYDYNGDGRYTNNIDINGDGVVNMKDWEIGAMLVVNSWGVGWGNGGKVWVMYRLLAESPANGGIWNNAAMVVKPKKTYDPLLTVKAKIRYNQRNRIKIQVGISQDMNAVTPDLVMDYPCFSFQGDTLPMQGYYGLNSDLLEIGLDITTLLNQVPANGQAKIFLEVIQKSGDPAASGRIESFSVMDYSNGTHETAYTEGPVVILQNATTRLAVPVSTTVHKPEILNEELPEAQVGLEYRAQMEADGTTGPYRYANPANWFVEEPVEPAFNFNEGAEVFTQAGINARLMDIPFSFPFYGSAYNQVTVLSDGGIVMGQDLVKYPYVIDSRLQFYQNKGIFPCFGNLYYPNSNFKVTFEASAQEVIIRWHAALDTKGALPLEFAARLLPDGTIRFYYGTVNTGSGNSWISGLSAGNNLDFYLMENNYSGIKNNSGFKLGLLDWPGWLSLGSNGDLHGTPSQSGLYTLPFRVTDWNGISNTKVLSFKVIGGSIVPATANETEVKIGPNPVSDDLWLDASCTSSGVLSFIVYDLTGQEVFSREFSVNTGRNIIHCSGLTKLNSGVYLFRLNGALSAQGKLLRKD